MAERSALADARGKGPGVADVIRAAILDGDYRAGERLIELDLANRFGASRAHVREALRQLRSEGLVDIEVNRGAMVRRITREEVYLAGRVREALEGLAARQLAERGIKGERRGHLVDLRARLIEAAESRDFDRYGKANDALHRFIIAECGNPYLVEFLDRLRLLVRQTQHLVSYRSQALFDGNVEHLAIIDAILLGHPDVAETMMRMHVRKGTEYIDGELASKLDGD